MSKAMIGIKIADGSFYPILEEGKPGEKKLEVTTVRDDQTTVQINLYRSESGKMEDADYVDTLLIDNLVPHPKEEPSFSLVVKIDENDVLSAEIDDPETGGKSDTSVSLVNMGNKSIFDEPDYTVTDGDLPIPEAEEDKATVAEEAVEPPAMEESIEEPVFEEPVAEAVLSDDDFSFSTDFLDEEKKIEEDEKPFSFDSLPDFDDIPELTESTESGNIKDDDIDIDFSLPEENDIGKSEDYSTDYSNQEPEYEYAPQDNMQSALFGGDDLFEETRKKKDRKTVASVVICILCAIISMVVLGIILYMTPSIMKLVGKIEQDDSAVTQDLPIEAESQGIMAEESSDVEKQPVVRQAEENKIVILNETVPPSVPENNSKKEDFGIIQHLVKWGDTLWDLAGFYYRNPWLFSIISDANHLENPDFIVSGTYLDIPER